MTSMILRMGACLASTTPPAASAFGSTAKKRCNKGLNIKHFVLMSPASTAKLDVPLSHQRAGDLPNPVQFYPGDVVYKSDDLLKVERLIERVYINKEGNPVYTLAETQDDTEARQVEDKNVGRKPAKKAV